MGIANRLKKIEIKAHAKISGVILVDGDWNTIEGDILRMPKAETPGLAILPDGTQKAIIYEAGWRDMNMAFHRSEEDGTRIYEKHGRQVDSELPTDSLRIRPKDLRVIHISYFSYFDGSEEDDPE
jgi:hypothetical protein